DVDLLGVIGAAKAVRIVVVIGNPKFSAMVVARIAPLIADIGAAGIETIIIGFVGIAAVFTVQISGQCRTHGAPAKHAGDRRTGTSAAASGSIAEQPADECPDNDACRIGRVSAFAVIGIVIVAIGPGIALAPNLVAVVAIDALGNDPAGDCRKKKIIAVVADPAITARRLSEAALPPVRHEILILAVLFGQPVAARPPPGSRTAGIVAAVLTIIPRIAALVVAIPVVPVPVALLPAIPVVAIVLIAVWLRQNDAAAQKRKTHCDRQYAFHIWSLWCGCARSCRRCKA